MSKSMFALWNRTWFYCRVEDKYIEQLCVDSCHLCQCWAVCRDYTRYESWQGEKENSDCHVCSYESQISLEFGQAYQWYDVGCTIDIGQYSFSVAGEEDRIANHVLLHVDCVFDRMCIQYDQWDFDIERISSSQYLDTHAVDDTSIDCQRVLGQDDMWMEWWIIASEQDWLEVVWNACWRKELVWNASDTNAHVCLANASGKCRNVLVGCNDTKLCGQDNNDRLQWLNVYCQWNEYHKYMVLGFFPYFYRLVWQVAWFDHWFAIKRVFCRPLGRTDWNKSRECVTLHVIRIAAFISIFGHVIAIKWIDFIWYRMNLSLLQKNTLYNCVSTRLNVCLEVFDRGKLGGRQVYFAHCLGNDGWWMWNCSRASYLVVACCWYRY